LGKLAIDGDATVVCRFRVDGAVGRGAAASTWAPPAALAVTGALLGLFFLVLVEILRSFADSHGQLLANWGLNDIDHRR
jgi:hypothetical protein